MSEAHQVNSTGTIAWIIVAVYFAILVFYVTPYVLKKVPALMRRRQDNKILKVAEEVRNDFN